MSAKQEISDPSKGIRRMGVAVVVAIAVWSAGWFAIHKVAEARNHALVVNPRD
jgi:hypothetical protein